MSVAVCAVAATAAVEAGETQKHFLSLTRGQDNIEGEKSEVVDTNCWAQASTLPGKYSSHTVDAVLK